MGKRVQLLETVRVGQYVFMVMEKAEKDLLSVIVEQGPLSEDRVGCPAPSALVLLFAVSPSLPSSHAHTWPVYLGA